MFSQLPGSANLTVLLAITCEITHHVSFHATLARPCPLNQGISYNGHQPRLKQCGSRPRPGSVFAHKSAFVPLVPPAISPNTPFNSDPAGTIWRYPPFGQITLLLLPPCCRPGRLTSSLGVPNTLQNPSISHSTTTSITAINAVVRCPLKDHPSLLPVNIQERSTSPSILAPSTGQRIKYCLRIW